MYVKNTWLGALICKIFGHKWIVLRDARAKYFKYFNENAGCDADCSRCGEEWRDYDDYKSNEWIYKNINSK